MADENAVLVKTMLLLLGGLSALAIVVMLIAMSFGRSQHHSSNALVTDAMERTAPVGKLNIAGQTPEVEEPAATPPATAKVAVSKDPLEAGKSIYNSVCMACHGQGIAGAPKLSDKDDWSARAQQGYDVLVTHAVQGFQGKKGLMPPKGGRADLSEDEVKHAVTYMLDASGQKTAIPPEALKSTGVQNPRLEKLISMRTSPMYRAAFPMRNISSVAWEESPRVTRRYDLHTSSKLQTTAADEGSEPRQAAAGAETGEEGTTSAPAHKTTDAATGAAPADGGGKGKEIYESVCSSCHSSGVAGAPKLGDKETWAPRVAQGMDTLYERALKGYMGKIGMMPPKGGRLDLPDEDVKAAVDYMVSQGQ